LHKNKKNTNIGAKKHLSGKEKNANFLLLPKQSNLTKINNTFN
jgi:hypothetical protein